MHLLLRRSRLLSACRPLRRKELALALRLLVLVLVVFRLFPALGIREEGSDLRVLPRDGDLLGRLALLILLVELALAFVHKKAHALKLAIVCRQHERCAVVLVGHLDVIRIAGLAHKLEQDLHRIVKASSSGDLNPSQAILVLRSHRNTTVPQTPTEGVHGPRESIFLNGLEVLIVRAPAASLFLRRHLCKASSLTALLGFAACGQVKSSQVKSNLERTFIRLPVIGCLLFM